MAASDPVVLPAGALILAGDLDPVEALTGAWSSYTPTWTASTSNPAIGSGTITGEYVQAGKLIIGRINVTMAGDTTFGTGFWRFTLPLTADITPSAMLCSGVAIDASSSESIHRPVTGDNASATTVRLFSPSGGLSSTVPFTWATTDQLRIGFMYQAA